LNPNRATGRVLLIFEERISHKEANRRILPRESRGSAGDCVAVLAAEGDQEGQEGESHGHQRKSRFNARAASILIEGKFHWRTNVYNSPIVFKFILN
jgi:hypothetical protein